jgi:hypothetical protein
MYDSTSEHNFPYPVTWMLITTPNLLSRAHFHHILSTRFQKPVHHNGQQVIWHNLFLIPYSLSMSSHLAVPISRLLFFVISHPRFSVLQGMLGPYTHSWVLCKNENKKCRTETVFHVVNVLCYIFNARWIQLLTEIVHRVQCWLQCIGQLLIISSEFNIKGLENPWRWVNLDITTLLWSTQCEN